MEWVSGRCHTNAILGLFCLVLAASAYQPLSTASIRVLDIEDSAGEPGESMMVSIQMSLLDLSRVTTTILLSRLRLNRIGPGDCGGATGITYESEPNSRTPPPNFDLATRIGVEATVVGTIVGETALSVEGDDFVDLFVVDQSQTVPFEVSLQLGRPGAVAMHVLSRASGATGVVASAETGRSRSAQLQVPESALSAPYFIQLHALDTDGRPTGYRLTLQRTP